MNKWSKRMSVILPRPRRTSLSCWCVSNCSIQSTLKQKKAKTEAEHCHCKHFNIPPSHLSPPPPSQFVTRLPRGPLLDFYSKRSWGAVLTWGNPPPTHTGVSPGDHSSSSVLASLPSSLRLLFNITVPFLIFHPLDLRSLSSFPWKL